MDKLTYAANRSRLVAYQLNSRVCVFVGDVSNEQHVQAAMDGCSDVFHFAAESHVPRSFETPDIFMKTNIDGTSVLSRVALENDIIRFIHISTDEVYGSTEDFVEESFPMLPTTPYAFSKAEAEGKVMKARAQGLDAIIIRPTNAVGVGQHCEKVTPKFVQQTLGNQATKIEGDGSQTRTFLPVEDLCRAIILTWQGSPSCETYNVAGREVIAIRELAETIWKVSGNRPQIVTVTDRVINDHDYLLNARKIEKLGYEQKSTLLDEINKLFEYFQINQNSKHVG